MLKFINSCSIYLILFWPTIAFSKNIEYDLIISEKKVNKANKVVTGLTINNGIPGPTLFFKEGDTAIIRVQNKMNMPSSIHWHGVLLPNNMDGVPFITYPPIPPHTTFEYEFPIRQSGTYWYHSHTSLQEQKGVYGSIVIYPKGTLKSDEARVAKKNEKVVVLSDWTNENPHAVLHTLRQGNEWYSIKKRTAQSIFGAMKIGMLTDYFKREIQRMPPMDIADVGYDAFLINGMTQDSWDVRGGENVRLRVINASASSFFYINFANDSMTIVSSDGIDIEPIKVDRLLVGAAETYDLIVKVPHKGSAEFRATSQDNSGYTSLWIGSGKQQPAKDIPYPNQYKAMGSLSLEKIFALTPAGSMGMSSSRVKAGEFDKPGMAGMHGMKSMDMNTPDSMPMNHGANNHHTKNSVINQQTDTNNQAHSMHMVSANKHVESTIAQNHTPHHNMTSMDLKNNKHKYEDSSDVAQSQLSRIVSTPSIFKYLASDMSNSFMIADEGSSDRPWSPYNRFRSIYPTNFGKDRIVREFRLTLDGDMERYVWLINNKTVNPNRILRIKYGEIVRFIMINRTMMHHPMHLHGHFFRVINSQGDYSPLKHTVNVAPMSTVIIEFDANDSGDWVFHCHNLYHMHSAMKNFVHYDEFKPSQQVEFVRNRFYKDSFFLLGQGYLLSNITSGFLEFSNTNNIFMGEWEYGLQDNKHNEWELILTYSRYINRFLSVFAGTDLLGERFEELKVRGILGFEYLLPLNIDMRIWIDSDLGGRISFGKHLKLTPRLTLNLEAEYDRHAKWEGVIGLDFQITKQIFASGQWHSEYKWGGGAKVIF